MRFYTITQQSPFYQTQRINQSIQQQKTPAQGVKSKRQDIVDFSANGKKALALSNIQKQKESILKQKDALLQATLDRGGSIEDVQEQLDLLNLRMEELDLQMVNSLAEETLQMMENIAKPKEEAKRKKIETEEDLEKQKMNDLMDLSSSVEQSKTVSNVHTTTGGQATQKESELKLDRFRLDVRIQKRKGKHMSGPEAISFALEGKALAAKKPTIDNLKKIANQATLLSNDVLEKANQKHAENQTHYIEHPPEETKVEKEEREEQEKLAFEALEVAEE